MIRKMMMMGLLMSMLTTASYVFAEDVYATKNGKKYHTEHCQLIKNKSPQAIEKEAAVKKGLTPCSRCFKQQALKKDENKKLN